MQQDQNSLKDCLAFDGKKYYQRESNDFPKQNIFSHYSLGSGKNKDLDSFILGMVTDVDILSFSYGYNYSFLNGT